MNTIIDYILIGAMILGIVFFGAMSLVTFYAISLFGIVCLPLAIVSGICMVMCAYSFFKEV